MKPKLHLWLGIAFSLALCIIFASVFISYSQPMKDDVYDLSVVVTLNEIEDIDTSETLGWTVYTQSGEDVTLLTYDNGCFDGLSQLGQTFYFSRVMQEKLDAPTIQLGTANRNFSVFLDGVLIYTDFPEADNRIGYLTLPMREFDRKEDVTISLPEDYVGKTLTIAQSSPTYAETPYMATHVIPATVKLYCSYAYESALIAESFQTACIGAVCYVFGLILLVLFVRQLFLGKFDWSLLFLTLAVFLSMTVQMYNASYSFNYFDTPTLIDIASLCKIGVICAMLAFLSTQFPRFRGVCWGLTGLYVFSAAMFVILGRSHAVKNDLFSYLVWNLHDTVSAFSLLIMLILSWFCRRHSSFFQAFAPFSVVVLLLYLGVNLLLSTRSAFLTALLQSLTQLGLLSTTYHAAVILMLVSMVIVEVQIIRQEITLHTEKQLMLEMSRMSQQRYENLRIHNEEVMTLRHDMIRHFTILRQMTTEERPAQYLDDLIGQNEKIRSVIQSGNEMIDIILSSRLSLANDVGLQIEVVRATAPEKLPLSDTDLCSLTMNLIDNAIEAALKSSVAHPDIKLDLHVKNNFFVFICENSTSATANPSEKEETLPKHGLGLKIIRQIAERYDALLQTEISATRYKVSLAIPLAHPSK